MTNQTDPNLPDCHAPAVVDTTNDVVERREALQGDDAAPPGRTYTVAGIPQVQVPQKSLGSYVKAR